MSKVKLQAVNYDLSTPQTMQMISTMLLCFRCLLETQQPA